MVGKTVSHYRILEKLGGGGMGVVYKAEDTKLGRTIALKFLGGAVGPGLAPAEGRPKGRPYDLQALERFKREARAASALNHPNIITIYDIDEAEGVQFIAMEYVAGKTLDRLIARHGLRLNEVLKYAVQMAAALAKAHSAGIVHRDLKPTNVMVTDDGLVKVLDFGLAKLTEAAPTGEAETVATVQPTTEEGTIVGTVGYMSPEQAEGKPVDARSDIFSFGSVLYEMLTGQRAFQGETKASTIAAILREEPKPLSQVAQGLPREVERLVKRCLRKDREHRVQHMDDLKLALEELREESDSGALVGAGLVPAREGRPRGAPLRRWVALAVAGALAVAAVGLSVAWFVSHRPPPPAPRVLGIHQITHTGGQKQDTLVTDGARVYFTEISGGHVTPMAVTAAGGDAVPIPMPLKAAMVASITPDSSELMVVAPESTLSDRTAVWHVSVLGGSPRRVGDLVADTAAETPDGRGLLYAQGSDVYLANADGTRSRKLLSVPSPVADLCYSPDESGLRITLFGPTQIPDSIWEASPDGSNLHRFLPAWNRGGSKGGGRWTPDGRYFVFQATEGGNSNIWALREGGVFDKSGRQPVQLTTGPMQNGGVPVISKDGKRVFFVGTQSNAELSVYDSRLHEFVPYLGGIPAESVSFSRDGQWVAYVRLPEGTLWRMKIDGSDKRQLTFPPLRVFLPRWSPDGTRLAFCDVPPEGHSRIFTVPVEGGTPEALTSAERDARDPTWSPDGSSLMFHFFLGTPDSSVQVLDLNTHKVTELPGSKGFFSARWSPDGRYAVALRYDMTLMLFDFKTQKWEMLAAAAGYPNWSKDGKFVSFVRGIETPSAFRWVEIATRKIQEVASIGNARTVNGIAGCLWAGATPDGLPLIAREAGTQEIYALDVEFP
jgi:Tol biopolymer transport system component